MDNQYENESLAVRMITLTNSPDTKIKVSAYKKLVDVCKQMGWSSYSNFYNFRYLEELVKTIRSDSNLSSNLSGTIMNCIQVFIIYSEFGYIKAHPG